MPPESLCLLAAFDRIGQVVVGAFAVAGGFLVGNWLTYLGVKVGCKLLLRKQPPAVPTRVARVLGGLGLALLVAYFVFGEHGFGLGGGSNTDTGPPGTKAVETAPKKDEVKSVVPKAGPVEGEPAEERVRVTVLGGDVREGRFYLFEDDPQPHTFAELTSLIRERMNRGPRPVRGVAIYVYSNSAARGTRVVTDLQDWANDQGLAVTFPPVQEQPRPGS